MARKVKLTAKEKAFTEQFPIDLNQTRAAIRAGYSKKSAKRMAVQVMNKPAVREEIRKKLARRAKKFEAVADNVISDLADIAHLDRSVAFRVLNNNLYVTDTDLLPPRLRRCISKVSQTQYGMRLEFDDRMKALELLGRHLALFTDNLNLSGGLKATAIDNMTEEDIDAELARIESKKTAPGKEESASENEPS